MLDGTGAGNAGEPDGLPRQPVDFEITYTDDGWTWAGETRPGLPILHYPDGSVCEPVLLYFGYSAEMSLASTSSMRVEAYAVREFLCFLWNRGLRWDQADDRALREWRERQKQSTAAIDQRRRSERAGTSKGRGPAKKVVRTSPRQVERKIAFVVEFYRLLPEAMCLERNGKPWPAFVGSARSKKAFPIKTKTYSVRTPFGRRTVSRWVGAARLPAGTVRRPAPTQAVVGRILARLRSAAAIEPTCRPTRSAIGQSRQESERNWLQGRCEAEAGLRCEEVVDLSLPALARALAEEGIGGGLAGMGGITGKLLGMPNEEARDRIIADLEDLAVAGRQDLGVEVTCKGRTRKAPFPIPLVRDLLQIGLWTVRAAQVRNWTEQHPGYVPPSNVFLSFKTGRGLTPGALGDVIKAAFEPEGLLGSGHRLRAFFGTELALRLLQVRLSLNGYRYDLGVEQWVLQHVAEAMGHAQPSTTVASYVDRALMRLVGVPSETVLSGMISVHRALLANAATLTDDDFSRVLRSILQSRDAPPKEIAATRPSMGDPGLAPDRKGVRSGEAAPERRRRQPVRSRAAGVRDQAKQLVRRNKIAARFAGPQLSN